MGEFGRTPKINPNQGRDHWPKAFSVVLAGGGVQGGRTVGETDAEGFEIQERPAVLEAFDKGIQSILIGEGTPTTVAQDVQHLKNHEAVRHASLRQTQTADVAAR
jgi:uncharacterized protein (DUF1501 family)